MIDKLAYVVALARERHFGRAAESCGVTQPTLSAGLKQLEESLGVLIVQRSSRFLGFTLEGERVLAWARRLVNDAEAMRQEVDALKQGLTGHLRLAAVPSALPAVARLTTAFSRRHPAVRFAVSSRPSDEIMRGLDSFDIDAGLTYLDHDGAAHIRSVRLYDERYCYVSAAVAGATSQGAVAWTETHQAALCLLSEKMQNRRIIDRAARAAGVSLLPKLETDSVLVLLAHVRTGEWASILPATLLDLAKLPPGIIVRPMAGPDVVNAIGLVVPDREPMAPLVHALFTDVRAEAGNLFPASAAR